jgi:hypothetical protein
VKIAPEHAEGEGVAPGQAVEKRFLLGRVALEGRHVSGRRVEYSVAVESHLADSAPIGADETAVAARDAPDRAVGGPEDEIRGSRARIEELSQRRGAAVGGESVTAEQRNDAATGGAHRMPR